MIGRYLVAAAKDAPRERRIPIRVGLVLFGIALLAGGVEISPLASKWTIGGVAGFIATGVVAIPVLRLSPHAERVGIAIRYWINPTRNAIGTSLSEWTSSKRDQDSPDPKHPSDQTGETDKRSSNR